MELDTNYLKQITEIINDARNKVETTVNSELVTLYWNVEKVIKTQILSDNKSEYGKSVKRRFGVLWRYFLKWNAR